MTAIEQLAELEERIDRNLEKLLGDPGIDFFWNYRTAQGRIAQVLTPLEIPEDATLVGFEVVTYRVEEQAELFGPPKRTSIADAREIWFS